MNDHRLLPWITIFGIFLFSLTADGREAVHADMTSPLLARSDGEIANYLNRSFSLVVVGHFEKWSQEELSINPLEDPRIIAARFKVEETLKGDSASFVPIMTESDMWEYPKTQKSTYQKRRTLIDDLGSERKEITNKLLVLKQDFDAGRISLAQYDSDGKDLTSKKEEVTAVYISIPHRMIGVVHGSTFYEVVGVLRSNSTYLLGLNPDESGQYSLNEIYDGNIFWGARALAIAKLLRRK